MSKKVDLQLQRVLNQLDKALLLLGGKVKTVTDTSSMNQICYKVGALKNLYYSHRQIEKLKQSAKKTKYKEYPYKVTDLNGYIILYTKDFYGVRSEHRYLMDKKIGRQLLPTEIIHHIDCNPSNNKLKNLMITSRKDHINLHRDIRNKKKATL